MSESVKVFGCRPHERRRAPAKFMTIAGSTGSSRTMQALESLAQERERDRLADQDVLRLGVNIELGQEAAQDVSKASREGTSAIDALQ